MAFESFAAFLAMGGHGVFVWLAYGFSLCCLAALYIWPSHQARVYLLQLKQQQLREQHHRSATTDSGESC